MPEFQKLVKRAEEFLVCAKLLPAIRARYVNSFGLLEIPEVLRSDPKIGQFGTVYFKEYDGQKYNGRWDEANGGSDLGRELCFRNGSASARFSKDRA